MQKAYHTKSAPEGSVQLLLWEIANKETSIFVSQWPNMAQYRDDLRSHVFVKIVSVLESDIASLGEKELRQYLKKSIQNQLRRCARDIESRSRYSPLEYLNSTGNSETWEDESPKSPEEVLEHLAYELHNLSGECPSDRIEKRELLVLIQQRIDEADPIVRQIVCSRLAGASIRTAASLHGLSKSTAARLFEAFAVKVREQLR